MASSLETRQAFDHYDVVIATCGYESRSRVLLSEQIEATVRKAVGYSCKEQAAFGENASLFARAGYDVERVSDDLFTEWFETTLRESHAKRVLIDISCMTRTRLAAVVSKLSEYPTDFVDFYYSLAEFTPPTQDDPQHEFLGPVSEHYSGWAGEYGKPVAVISGLGYEHAKALGLIDFLDPADTWLFFPSSPIAAYDRAVRQANEILLCDVDESRVLHYEVLDATALVSDLSALVASIRSTHRCVVLPLGPKIFAFAALLVGAAYRDVSVWRASAGKFSEPTDRQPSAFQTLFRVVFIPEVMSENEGLQTPEEKDVHQSR